MTLTLYACNLGAALRFHRYPKKNKSNRYFALETNPPPPEIASVLFRPCVDVLLEIFNGISQYCEHQLFFPFPDALLGQSLNGSTVHRIN